MMKKVCTLKITIIAMIGVGIFLTGCGNRIPEMTPEEETRIVLYATEVIAKHSEEYPSRLIDTQKEAIRREEVARKAAQVQSMIEAQKQAEVAEREQNKELREEIQTSSGETDLNMVSATGDFYDLAEFLNMKGLEIDYAGYELVKSYAGENSDDWSAAFDEIEAEDGKNLLLIRINVNAVSPEGGIVDSLGQNLLFKVSVNGERPEHILPTLLMNDFRYASDELQGGECKNYVLIAQVPENQQPIKDLLLISEKGDETLSVQLSK